MKTTVEYIDAAKKALNIESDYKFCQWLGMPRQAANNWRKGKNGIDDYVAVRIAEALGIEPMEIIAAANYEREKGEERKTWWGKIFQKHAQASMTVLFLCLSFNGLAMTIISHSYHYV